MSMNTLDIASILFIISTYLGTTELKKKNGPDTASHFHKVRQLLGKVYETLCKDDFHS